MPSPAVGAGIGLAGIGGALIQSNAASKAAQAQSNAAMAGIQSQEAQFARLMELLRPYQEAGVQGLGGLMGLSGLSGSKAQQEAIDAIKAGAGFQEQLRRGEESILGRASATGGLRGGNVQAALAQFAPALLNQEVQRQYDRLAGITTMGQQSAAGIGSSGMQMGSNIANLLANAGAAQAGGTMAQGQIWGQLPSQLMGGLAMYGTGIQRGMW